MPVSLEDNDRWLILGKSGSGKSWLARYIFIKYYYLPRKRDRYFVIDIKRTHYQPAKRPGEFGLWRLGFRLQKVTYADILKMQEQGVRWSEYMQLAHKIVFQIAGEMEQQLEIAARICRAAHNAGNAVVLIDEGGVFYPNKPNNPRGVDWFFSMGRENGNDVILVCQHWVMFQKLAASAANRLICIGNFSANERKHLAPEFENGEALLGKLQKRQFIYRNKNYGYQFVGDTTQLSPPPSR